MKLVKLCTRFTKCSVNNCPLHSDYPNLYIDEYDPEQKCQVEKSHRIKIAATCSDLLEYDGLTTKEYGGIDGWTKRTEESILHKWKV